MAFSRLNFSTHCFADLSAVATVAMATMVSVEHGYDQPQNRIAWRTVWNGGHLCCTRNDRVIGICVQKRCFGFNLFKRPRNSSNPKT